MLVERTARTGLDYARLEGTGVTADCVHPGVVRTNLGLDSRLFRIMSVVLLSPEQGSATSVTSPTHPSSE